VPLSPAEIPEFYERGYARALGDGEWLRKWREVGARSKADHVCRLLRGIPAPRTIVEVGCGEGAVLAELARRGVGETRTGIDISASAIKVAAGRPEITRARVFDGLHIDAADQHYDLAVCTHVLEHLADPGALLAEIERVARAVVVEVPLERNLSARRPSARALSEESGHVQRFDRAGIRQMVQSTGWTVHAEVLDHLPLEVYRIRATDGRGVAIAYAKWTVRCLLAALPPLGERVMTMHYAVLACPPGWLNRSA